MEKLILRFLFFISLLYLAACSPGAAGDVTGIDAYTVTSGNFTTANSSTLSGLGSVRFINVLNGAYSSNSLSLKTELSQTGNSVTAIFNSNSTVMNTTSGAVAVTFTRSGTTVTCSIGVAGSSVSVNASRLVFYVPTALDVIIDVHNISSTRSHVLIWRRDLTVYTAANADVDTDQTGDYTGTYPNAAGTGSFVGLSLNNATVTGAQVGLPKVVE